MVNVVELPAEILCEIFHLAQVHVAAELVDFNLVEGNVRLAIAVSQVCQHWRNAALGFAGLWVYIAYQHQHYKRIPQIKEYIRRSNDQPLTLFLSFSEEVASERTRSTCVAPGQAAGSECLPMIDILEEYLDQAEYICIEEPRPRASLIILYDRKHPRLKSLSFRRLSWSTSPRHDGDAFLPATFYEPCTTLKYLHLDGVSFHPDCTVLATNLETLSLYLSSIPIHNTLIPSASTLTSLTLGPKIAPYPTVLKGTFRQVAFSALETLTLVNNLRFMGLLVTPNLKTLNLRSCTYSALVEATDPIMLHQETTMPKLEVLSIQLFHENAIPMFDEDGMLSGVCTLGSVWAMGNVWMSVLFHALSTVNTMHWDVCAAQICVLRSWARALGDEANWAQLREVTVNSEHARKAVLKALPYNRRNLAGMIKRQ